MLKRSIILLFAVTAIAGSINAQVRPGLKVGYNLSGVIGDNLREFMEGEDPSLRTGDPGNFKLKSGFNAGLFADCPISDVLSIHPGAKFSMQGFQDDYRTGHSSSGIRYVNKFSLFYLQIPVYAQYRMYVAEETHLLFQAGPYVGFGLFGRQTRWSSRQGSIDINDDHKKIKFGNNPAGNTNEDIQTIDYGIGAGIGFEFFRFQLMLNYDFGLNKPKFNKRTSGGGNSTVYHLDMRNHCFSVTFAVIFGRRDPLQNIRD